MTGIGISFVVQAALLATAAQPYKEAYQTTLETGKPLLVLVGADWCPACVTMKRSTIADLEQSGKLDCVAFSMINTDRDPTLAGRLMSGQSIPQLIVYTKTPTGWKRAQLTGAQSKSTVEAFIQQAMKEQTVKMQNVSSE